VVQSGKYWESRTIKIEETSNVLELMEAIIQQYPLCLLAKMKLPFGIYRSLLKLKNLKTLAIVWMFLEMQEKLVERP
jgi:hypothetical protein